jgi:hypothetical protein
LKGKNFFNKSSAKIPVFRFFSPQNFKQLTGKAQKCKAENEEKVEDFHFWFVVFEIQKCTDD